MTTRKSQPGPKRRVTRRRRPGTAPGAALIGLVHDLEEHHEVTPRLTGGDLDANWDNAQFSGDESAVSSSPTPDQSVVDEIGTAMGISYSADEELKVGEKERSRDKHRWELDPASSEDWQDRNRGQQ